MQLSEEKMLDLVFDLYKLEIKEVHAEGNYSPDTPEGMAQLGHMAMQRTKMLMGVLAEEMGLEYPTEGKELFH